MKNLEKNKRIFKNNKNGFYSTKVSFLLKLYILKGPCDYQEAIWMVEDQSKADRAERYLPNLLSLSGKKNNNLAVCKYLYI